MSKTLAAQTVSRRQFVITVAAGSAAAAALSLAAPSAVFATEDAKTLDEAIKHVVGDKELMDGASVITLELPQIAENGNTVPLGISIDSPMTEADHVTSVHLFAAGNPRPDVASFNFSPSNGYAEAATRMRLAKTQDIIAIAEMSDGKAYMTRAEVKVTIGGCGG